jgi:Druantia protein DruA
VGLLQAAQRERFDRELAGEHYLKHAHAIGRVLRYVAEYRGRWVGLLVFSSAVFHLKVRDQWLHGSPRQVKERRHRTRSLGRSDFIPHRRAYFTTVYGCGWARHR